ncbi:MAG: mammalian cell entry protein [Comamonadaceae bacterium CG12_big_fil_rev_8_21_14_0_65_59_15]|nr:MAG: mammalian cell entry protein [Comamonadaceae bacterium CG12_big_fil_rev_8_21_14_0_65_59_15]
MNPSDADPTPPIAHLERKARLLLWLVAAVIAGFVLYVMVARGVFERTQQLVLVSDDSEGVIVGMDLTFSGFPIGRVRRIELADDGKARMVIDVPLKDARWLRSSSIFTLERGMVGDTRIRAYSGILTDPPLPAGSERTLLRGDTAAEIPRLVASARALLEHLDNMTAPEASLATSLAHLNTLSERLTGRYGMLTGVLGSEDNAKKIITTLERTNALLAKADQRVFGPQGVLDSTQGAIDSAKTTLDSSNEAVKQLSTVLQESRQTLTRLDAVLAQAQAVGSNVRVATTDLNLLRAEVEASLRKVGQLTNEINRKWPFTRDTEIKLP